MTNKNNILYLILISLILSHDTDFTSSWRQYFRGSYIIDESGGKGFGGYFRLNKKNNYTFRDLRAYLHFVDDYRYKKIRYKSSNKFLDFTNIYNFSTVSIDQNSKIGVDIRYHGNQGIGFFIKETNNARLNAEIALSYDISDYLNDSRKTSYIKSGVFYDKIFKENEIKIEIEYYSQITDLIDEIDLSRFEFLIESHFNINESINFIIGCELENFNTTDKNFNSSIFFSIGYDKDFDIKKFKHRFKKN